MALSITLNKKDNFGREASFASAYLCIESVTGSKSNLTVSLVARDKKDGVFIESNQINVPIDLEGDNFIKQSYLYIKSMPDYSSASDC
ncbi:hypothetical protein [Tolumonas lignilytica]|uniref:hypothetical protein n=1 Tax=Tolumonas lignilytica TaxID=1283284 RepID=UPI00046539CD|nr:hypothetical protein [Tolumonas lignilytica]